MRVIIALAASAGYLAGALFTVRHMYWRWRSAGVARWIERGYAPDDAHRYWEDQRNVETLGQAVGCGLVWPCVPLWMLCSWYILRPGKPSGAEAAALAVQEEHRRREHVREMEGRVLPPAG